MRAQRDHGDAALVERARTGDHEAFAVLFRRHAPTVVRFAERRSGSSAWADDITAVVFEKAWRSLDSIGGAGDRFRPWILRIAANETVSRHRSEQRRSDRERRTADAELPLRASADPQSATAFGAVDADTLRAAIDELSPTHQDVIMLRFFSDLSAAEVADALDVAPGTAAVRQHRALKALADVLDDRPDGDDGDGEVTS